MDTDTIRIIVSGALLGLTIILLGIYFITGIIENKREEKENDERGTR